MASHTDGRLQRGDQTRRTILGHAVDVASMEGLESLSLGRLAKELSISKSGVFAHFGSKEELQLATVWAGRRIFHDQVIRGPLLVRPGLERLWRLCESWIDYSRGRVFAGGCFFHTTTVEFESRPGRVRDALVLAQREWNEFLARTVEEPRQLGELREDTDPLLLAYEINALLLGANQVSLLEDDLDQPYAWLNAALRARLSAMITPATPAPWENAGEPTPVE